MWSSGLDVLWKHFRHWPEMPENVSSVADYDPELKRNATTVVAKEAKCFLHNLIIITCWIRSIFLMDQTTKSCRVVVEIQDLSQSEVLTQSWTPVRVSSQMFYLV